MKRAHDKILKKAIAHFGKESQVFVAIGEMGELLADFGRLAQGRITENNMADEIADVTIMMRQLALIYGAKKVDAVIELKMDRIKRRLGE